MTDLVVDIEQNRNTDRLDRLVAGIEMTAKVYLGQARAEALAEEIGAPGDKKYRE